MSSLAPFRVRLWDIAASNRGRGTLRAIITDASDIGVSSYANEGGEMFFTIPWNHPYIDECDPWERHYEVQRLNRHASEYETVGVGLLDNTVESPDEVIVYGRDYLSLFDASISSANQSYTSQFIGTIIQAELSAAIEQPGETDLSVTKFITLGTINATTTTTTALTSLQPRLDFVRQVIDIFQSDSSVRPIVSVTRSSPFTLSFNQNAGSDKNEQRLEFGGLINDFIYDPGFTDFATHAWAIGQKREGASILTSKQTYASGATYGIIQRATIFIDIVNQTALNNKTKRFARDIGTVGKNVSLGVRLNALGPWEWGELADSLPVVINRGRTQVNGLYTVWGQEWIGKADGSEDLFLSILPKET